MCGAVFGPFLTNKIRQTQRAQQCECLACDTITNAQRAHYTLLLYNTRLLDWKNEFGKYLDIPLRSYTYTHTVAWKCRFGSQQKSDQTDKFSLWIIPRNIVSMKCCLLILWLLMYTLLLQGSAYCSQVMFYFVPVMISGVMTNYALEGGKSQYYTIVHVMLLSQC